MSAKRWAIGMMARPFLVLDTETTGVGGSDEIVQIAVVDKGGIPLLNSLVKPTVPISSEAMRIHGITNAMVKDAPGMDFFAETIGQLLHHRTVIVYNSDFDYRLLHQSLTAVGRNPKALLGGATFEDLMRPYAQYWGARHRRGGYRWQALTDACKQQRIAVADMPAHSALGDALRTLALIKVMAGVKDNGTK